jgi:hypothetical protein
MFGVAQLLDLVGIEHGLVVSRIGTPLQKRTGRIQAVSALDDGRYRSGRRESCSEVDMASVGG